MSSLEGGKRYTCIMTIIYNEKVNPLCDLVIYISESAVGLRYSSEPNTKVYRNGHVFYKHFFLLRDEQG